MQVRHDHDEIERWIIQGEGRELDFKQSITSSAKIARTMVAFANNFGGRIVVGVGDSGYIFGIDPEEEMFMIDEAGKHYCDPIIVPEYIIHEFEDVSVLEARIPNSLHKPHKALDSDDTWKVYMRCDDKSILASRSTIQLLINDDGVPPERVLDTKESAVIKYLGSTSFITPKEYARMLNLSLQRARRILVNLSQEGFLLYHRDERGEYFSIK